MVLRGQWTQESLTQPTVRTITPPYSTPTAAAPQHKPNTSFQHRLREKKNHVVCRRLQDNADMEAGPEDQPPRSGKQPGEVLFLNQK